jgi:hypothetical protein
MSESCPRCQPPGRPVVGDAGALCSTHALQVLDEIVDELISDMQERHPADDPDRD